MSFSKLYVHRSKTHLRLQRVTTRRLQETDKAVIDVEAQDDGILAKIVVRSGDLMLVLVLSCSRVHVIGFRRVEERCRWQHYRNSR